MEAGTFEEEAIHFIVDRKQRLLKVPLLMTTFSSQALSPKISRTSQNSSISSGPCIQHMIPFISFIESV
jgi:hypothetical protein